MTTYRPHSLGVRKVFLALLDLKLVGYDPETEAPMALRKAESAPEPDVKVVRGRCEDYNPHMPTSADVAMVVEVSDSTLGIDRNRKGPLYAQSGIADYWIVNLKGRQLEVRRHAVRDRAALYGHRYSDIAMYGPGDAIAPLAAPKSPVKVVDLLP